MEWRCELTLELAVMFLRQSRDWNYYSTRCHVLPAALYHDMSSTSDATILLQLPHGAFWTRTQPLTHEAVRRAALRISSLLNETVPLASSVAIPPSFFLIHSTRFIESSRDCAWPLLSRMLSHSGNVARKRRNLRGSSGRMLAAFTIAAVSSQHLFPEMA